jgi:hypothetical protein
MMLDPERNRSRVLYADVNRENKQLHLEMFRKSSTHGIEITTFDGFYKYVHDYESRKIQGNILISTFIQNNLKSTLKNIYLLSSLNHTYSCLVPLQLEVDTIE